LELLNSAMLESSAPSIASVWRVFATAECFGTNEVNEVFTPCEKKAPADRRRLSVEALISQPRLELKHGIETEGPLM
jgi:hypothetical protein